MTPDAFRRLALALPEAVEGQHHGHPDFRAHGRVFASLHPDGRRAMVLVPPSRQRELVAAHGEVAEPANGAWGRQGCTMIDLAGARAPWVRAALADAWEHAQALAAARRAPKPKQGAKPQQDAKPQRADRASARPRSAAKQAAREAAVPRPAQQPADEQQAAKPRR